MEFSDPVDSNCAARFSPNGSLVARCHDRELYIQDADGLEDLKVFSLSAEASSVDWSPDGELLLCVCKKASVLELRSIEDDKWSCVIQEESGGVSEAIWSPDSRHVISFARFGVRASVWSLTGEQFVCEIPHPKLGASGVAFRGDGACAAIVSLKNGRDLLRVVDISSWRELASFEAPTKDLAGLRWNPDGHSLAVWDAPSEYFVVVLSPHGHLLKRYSAYSNALGVRSVEWSPDGQLIAIASCDNTVRILLAASWRLFAELEHHDHLENTVIFKEETSYLDGVQARAGYVVVSEAKYSLSKDHLLLPSTRTLGSTSILPGVDCMKWSTNGQYLASCDPSAPNAVRVWHVRTRSLVAVILQKQSINTFSWDLTQERLVVCTASGELYTWSPEGSSCVSLPINPFSCHSVQFSAQGDCILLQDTTQYTLAYDGVAT